MARRRTRQRCAWRWDPPDFLGDEINGFRFDADRGQRDAQPGNGVDAFLRDHRMGGFAVNLDAVFFACVGEAQRIELFRQVILPLALVEHRVGHGVEGGAARKAQSAPVGACQVQLEQPLLSKDQREPRIRRKPSPGSSSFSL